MSLLAACGGTQPLPDIDATVEPRVELAKAVPSATSIPPTATPTQAPPTATPTQAPLTAIPTQAPLTATPTQAPPAATPTQVPPTAAPTQVPPTAAPTQVPPTLTPTQVPPAPTPTITAKEKLISIGYNVPIVGSVDEARQEYVASLDTPEKYRQRFIEVQENLNSVLGGYPNYIYFAYNRDGTEEDAKPVFERMAQLYPIDNNGKPFKDWTIDELIERQSCLGGANPGEARTSTTNPYSVCLENLAFIESPFGEEIEHPYRNYIKMALHLAHEYFHHYQRVHALDRGLDYQTDRHNPETTVQAPTWWIEGAAVTFQNAWYKDNWQSLPGLKSLTLEQALSTSIANETNSRLYKENRKNMMGYGDSKVCSPDWYMSSLDETYDTFTGCDAAFMATPYLAYITSYKTVWIDIPQDYYDLGFWGSLEKHAGMSKQEFYDSYNEFLRTGDPDDEPPDGWAPPENYISEYADFLKIVPESDTARSPAPTQVPPTPTPIPDKSSTVQKISYIYCNEFIKPDGSLITFSDGGLNNSGDPSQMYICSNGDGTVSDLFQRQFESAIQRSVQIDGINYISCGDIKNVDGTLNTFPGGRWNDSLESSYMYICANEDKTVNGIYQQQIDNGALVAEVLGTTESNADQSTELTTLEYDEDRLCGGPNCLKCYACEACMHNDDCFSGICENGKCKPNNPGTKLRIGNSIPYTVHETFGFPQRTKNAHEKTFLMFAEEFYRLEPVVLFYVNGYDITLGDVEPTEPIPGTNQKSYEEVAQLWCDYILCDDVSAVEQSFRDGGKNDGGWGVTGRGDAGHEGEPIWIYIETPYYLEGHGEAGPAEGAIHEYIHLLHGAFGLPSCSSFENITYDPKCAGPDWWSEGQADYLGAVYPFLRKNDGLASNFDATGINKRFDTQCREYVQSGAYARGARISHVETEANPGNWFFATRITASPREALEAWRSNSLPDVDDNGYYTHVYQGGACAMHFLLDQTIDETTAQYLVDFLPMVVEEDSWFLAFLKWSGYESMDAFYTTFDEFLQSNYEADGPLRAQELLGRCDP